MEKMHINERGAHTTVIEGAKDVLKALRKIGVETAPGVIEANVGARGKNVKLKKLSDKTLEMVSCGKQLQADFQNIRRESGGHRGYNARHENRRVECPGNDGSLTGAQPDKKQRVLIGISTLFPEWDHDHSTISSHAVNGIPISSP